MVDPRVRGQLRNALSTRFTPSELHDLVVYQIALRDGEARFLWQQPPRSLATEIVEAAHREDWIAELILAARRERPRSAEFFTLSTDAGMSTVQPSALQRMIKKAAGFTDPRTLIEGMAKTEYHVCKIEVPQLNQDIIEGTGFLVGSDLVLTNYHVVRALLDKPATAGEAARPENVSVIFDYRRLPGQARPDRGKSYGLAAGPDWLVEMSPPSGWERRPNGPFVAPTEDELDFALLRLESAVGDETVGDSDRSDARGFVEMSDPTPPISAGGLVYILQHPNGRELALSHDVVLEEGNRRIRYEANTEPGSSGSPCFDQGWNLIAIHNSGDPNFSRGHDPEYNQGVPISLILDHLERKGKRHLIGQ